MIIEKLQIYQPYHQAKLISMNIFQMKKYCLLTKKNNSTSWIFLFLFRKIKTIEDQQIKQVDALMTLKLEELETIKDNKSDENEKL